MLASPIALLALTNTAFATITSLTPGGGVQAAIGASLPGDEIHLQAGTYSACLTFTAARDLTIVGIGSVTLTCSDPALAALDVRGTLRVANLVVEHSAGGRGALVTGNLTVSASTFRSPLQATVSGAGVYADSGDVTLRGVTFDGTSTTLDGGGVFLANSSTAFVQGTTFLATTANGSGGGLFVASGSTFTGYGLTFSANDATFGGGAYVSGTANLYDTNFALGTAVEGGGAWVNGTLTGTHLTFSQNTGSALNLVSGGSAYVQESLFDLNTGVLGGALRANGGFADLGGVVFTGNTASGIDSAGPDLGGGAAYVTGGATVYSRDSDWAVNSALGSGGGALYTASGTYAYLYGDAFDGNTAEHGGGALLDSFGQLTGVTFSGNTATLDGGGLYLWEDASPGQSGNRFEDNVASRNGGGVALDQRAYMYCDGCTNVGNDAAGDGGGAWVGNNATYYAYLGETTDNTAGRGGGAWSDSGFLTADNTRIAFNTATSGGGGLGVSSGDVSLFSARIDNNEGGTAGGGIYTLNGQYLYAGVARVCGNSASVGGGIYLENQGGPSNFLYNVAFVENTATSQGGALWAVEADGTGRVTFEYATVVGNSAPAYGGLGTDGFVADPLILDVSSSVFQANGDGGLSSPGVAAAEFQGSITDGVPLGYVDFGNNYFFTNPLVTGWTGVGDCTDDLTAFASSNEGGYATGSYGAGVGASVTYFWNDAYTDWDGDGYTLNTGDCGTFASNMRPGGVEVAYNFTDEDCLAGDLRDVDGDGALSSSVGGADCDDNNAGTGPGAFDPPGDGRDTDCGDDWTRESDQDLDGTLDFLDCAPLDPLVFATATDIPYDGIDSDCDGNEADVDGDGSSAAAVGGPDCDDYRADIGPAQSELWYDGVDQNCDGNDADQDFDGHDAVALGGDDCDDTNAAVAPTVAEIWYDGTDQDCDGNDDDQDGDTFPVALDCDDLDPLTFPGAVELADLADNDCDVGTPDPDTDGDGLLDYWESLGGTAVDERDSDGDGLDDGAEWGGAQEDPPLDTDGDGRVDALDADSDGDGVDDQDEGGSDTDGDGTPDRLDEDDDDDGIPTAEELGDNGDLDGDGLVDHLDPDRDGDGSVDGADPEPGSAGGDDDTATAPPKAPTRYGLGCESAPVGGFAWLAGLALALRRRPIR